jgi:hypothetical protein
VLLCFLRHFLFLLLGVVRQLPSSPTRCLFCSLCCRSLSLSLFSVYTVCIRQRCATADLFYTHTHART